jgi:formylglycine-generating enzyme required for sulfatase activity
MCLITGGTFTMGSENFYPEEAPLRKVRVSSFWMDTTPVTNAQFAAFVAATGYRSFAQVAPDPADYPGMDPALAVPGSAVFTMTDRPVPLDDPSQWWRWTPGADWAHPLGAESTIADIMDHPVVHIAYEDAAAYAAWAGKSLPTEAEHEFAARGGLEGKDYAWGDELTPGGVHLANTWQGIFPFANTAQDGWVRTSPVGAYPANPYGLYDMIGNVWEWCEDWWSLPGDSKVKKKSACCAVDNPRGAFAPKAWTRPFPP